MDSRSLQQFLAVVEHGTLGRAADAMNMTQSALTKSIHRLEHSLKVKLLERSRTGVRPTVYGAALLPHARTVSVELGTLKQTIDALRAGLGGRVAVGAGPSLTASVIPSALERIARQSPGLQVKVVEGVVADLMGKLQMGVLDLFIGTRSEEPLDRQLTGKPLFDDVISIVAGKAHPIHRRRRLELADLLGESWALPEEENSLAIACRRLFAAAGLTLPTPTVVTNSLVCVEVLLMDGRHLSVAPRNRRPWAADAYKEVRVAGGSWRREIWLYESARRTQSPAAVAFIKELRLACAPRP